MPPPTNLYQPYASVHEKTNGPGDARPTAIQVCKDASAISTLKHKTILITGCSSGLGVETARALYECGATLYLTARDVPKLEKVIDDITSKSKAPGTPRPVPIEMHLDSLASVRKAAEAFHSHSSTLNILICNAGVMACPEGKTQDGLETQIGTNHFAHFLLFQQLKPLLISSAANSGTTSRVITVSSAGHRIGGIKFDDMHFRTPGSYHPWASYGQSKTANIYMANSITRHYGAKNVHGLSLHPGVIMTELSRHLDDEAVEKAFPGGFEAMQYFFKSPEQGAATQVWAAVAGHFEGRGGVYLADVGECEPMAKDAGQGAAGYAAHAYDEEAEEKLWEISCKTVGVPED